MAYDNGLTVIRTTAATATGGAYDDGGDLLDSIAHEFDASADEDDVLAPVTHERSRHEAGSTGDHPCLKPYHVATHPTKIDWDALGFRGAPRRPVVKIIRVAFEPEGVDVRVAWRRSPLLLRQLHELPEVYQIDSKPPDLDSDFEDFLHKEGSKIIQERLNRVRNSTKNEDRVKLDPILTPDFSVAQEMRLGELRFVISPEIRQKIAQAAEAFRSFDSARSRGKRSGRRIKREEGDEDERPAKRRAPAKRGSVQRLNKSLLSVARAALKLVKERKAKERQQSKLSSKEG
jgi:hypothetical protein